MPLRILAVADEASSLLYEYLDPTQWTGIDFIVSCGDLHPGYLDFLATTLGKPLFYVRGNHDGGYSREQYEVGQDLHGGIVTYRGIRMAGFEGCRRYNHGNPQYTDREMSRVVARTRFSTLRRGVPDLVVTHAPPAGVQDGQDPCHRGFKAFNTLIEAWKPTYWLHGHTHAYEHGESVTVVGATTVINAYPYRVLEIPGRVPEMHTEPLSGCVPAGPPGREQSQSTS